MKTIKKIGLLSVAKVSGVMYAIFGFIAGIFMLVVSVIDSRGSGIGLFTFGIMAPIIMPFIYGLMGFIGGFISAWIYNFVARYIGGIQISFADEEPAYKE